MDNSRHISSLSEKLKRDSENGGDGYCEAEGEINCARLKQYSASSIPVMFGMPLSQTQSLSFSFSICRSGSP